MLRTLPAADDDMRAIATRNEQDMAHDTSERRTFRLLPSEEIGFAKPAIEYETADGDRRVKVAHEFRAPEPELARKANDPGWWIITVWLPVGATPIALVPDPDSPML
jgi:hypothetical protein